MSADGLYFLDTNILVYADDSVDHRKKAIAEKLIIDGLSGSMSRISAQVLGEYFVTVTRKIATPLSVAEACARMELLSLMPIVPIDGYLVNTAVSVIRRYGVSYWDALIVSAASASSSTSIYSEDLNSGQEYLGIKVINPFS